MRLAALFAAAGLTLVPGEFSDWRELAFQGIRSNTVVFEKGAISLEVDRSASPLVRAFARPLAARRIEVAGTVAGALNIPADRLWRKGFDDAFLRFGAIETGERRLSAAQRALVPDWLKECDDLFRATGGTGIGAIHCAVLLPDRAGWIGKTRKSGPSDLFHERVSAAPGRDGAFRLTLEVDGETPLAGLWISADGDDTGAKFRVTIDRVSVF